MATISDSGYPTLLNVLRSMKPDGSIETHTAELLAKLNPFLEDVPWIEGNLPTGHRVTSDTALPSPTWRRFNEGVDPSKSESVQYDETCGMLEAFSNVDVSLANLNGNAAAFRLKEDNKKVAGFGQEIERAFFYESVLSNPEKIHGLTPRYSATTGTTASSYVLKPGTNSGSNCHSIWLINWDPDSLHGIFPKGSMGGLQKEDLGKKLVNGANSKQMLAWVTHHKWDAGLCVQDYRKAVRLQWDPDDTTNFADTAKGLYLGMQAMLDTVFALGPNARFYMNRTSRTKLNAQLASNTTNFLEYVDLNGRRVPSFLGVPLRVTDSLVAETAIS